MSAAMVFFDMFAGGVLLYRAFPAIVSMGCSTNHCARLAYILLAVGSVGMIFSPTMTADWRWYSHVAVIAAFTVRTIVGRRPRDRLNGTIA